MKKNQKIQIIPTGLRIYNFLEDFQMCTKSGVNFRDLQNQEQLVPRKNDDEMEDVSHRLTMPLAAGKNA